MKNTFNRYVGDFLTEIENTEDIKEKTALLKQIPLTHWAVPLLTYIRYAFDTRIEFNIPSGDYPYTPSGKQTRGAKLDLFTAERTIWIYNKINPVVRYHEIYALDYFEEGISDAERARRLDTKILRERHYKCLLESLSSIEARILDRDVRQKQMVRYLPASCIKEVFGEWIPDQYLVSTSNTVNKQVNQISSGKISNLKITKIITPAFQPLPQLSDEEVDKYCSKLKTCNPIVEPKPKKEIKLPKPIAEKPTVKINVVSLDDFPDDLFDAPVKPVAEKQTSKTFWASKQEEKLHKQYIKSKVK